MTSIDHGVVGRVLEGLEQRVLDELGHRVGVPDDVDQPLARERPHRTSCHSDSTWSMRICVPSGADLAQVGMPVLEPALGEAGQGGREAPRVGVDAGAGRAGRR